MSLGWDDWAIVLSWVVLTAVTIGAELSKLELGTVPSFCADADSKQWLSLALAWTCGLLMICTSTLF
jgi:hypothetical protein